MPPPLVVVSNAVFLNIPYDDDFRDQYIAYIAGLTKLQLEPKVTLDIPNGDRRLNKIVRLIQTCRYSIHDLSRVELDPGPPPTPRFNMPCELGLAITWQQLDRRRHKFFVFESLRYRLSRSLSDLDGTDPIIHLGTPQGIMGGLRGAFRRKVPPTVPQMMGVYNKLQDDLPRILEEAGTDDVYDPSVFRALCFVALLFSKS